MSRNGNLPVAGSRNPAAATTARGNRAALTSGPKPPQLQAALSAGPPSQTRTPPGSRDRAPAGPYQPRVTPAAAAAADGGGQRSSIMNGRSARDNQGSNADYDPSVNAAAGRYHRNPSGEGDHLPPPTHHYHQQRDPEEYRAEYGQSSRPVSVGKNQSPAAAAGRQWDDRSPPINGTASKSGSGLSTGRGIATRASTNSRNNVDDDDDGDNDVGRLKAKNRSLKDELQDHASRLELLKTDNDNLIQRLGEARKEREKLEDELNEKMRELERLRKQDPGRDHGPPVADKSYSLQLDVDRLETELSRKSRAVDQLTSDKSQLSDKVRRLEAELASVQASGVAGAGRKTSGDAGEVKRLRMEVERLEEEVRRRTAAADDLATEVAVLKQRTISHDRERELEAKVDKLTRELDNNYRKLQEAVNDNERIKKTRIPAEIEHELNVQIDKLTANVKAKERHIDDLDSDVRKLTTSKNELEKNNAELQITISDLRREIQRNALELDELRDSREREVGRLRADNDRLLTELSEQTRAAVKGDGHRTSRGPPGAGGGPTAPSRDQLRPLQELIREQESHIGDLRREVETLRCAVTDYQKELERLRGLVNEDDVTRDKFHDIAGAHRRLLDENVRLLAMLDQRQQAEVKALTDKTDVVRNLADTKKRLEAGNRRIAQLERWLDEIYNDKDFEVIQKQGPYSRGHICRGGGALPKMSTAALSDRRKAQIDRMLGGGITAAKSGYHTDRV